MDKSPRSDEVFSAAIVHDIGKILLACGFPDRFGEVVRLARERSQPFHLVEPEIFGTTHAEVGAYLLGAWGLPFPIVEAVAYHHRPELVAEGDREVLMAVYLAEAFIEAHGTGTGAATPPLRPGVLETSGLTAADIAQWHAVARQQLEMFARGEEQ
jgi:HD-like signal output (HDOD) protein